MTDECIDLVPGADVVARATNATWFEWDDGSRLFHWRWPLFTIESFEMNCRCNFFY